MISHSYFTYFTKTVHIKAWKLTPYAKYKKHQPERYYSTKVIVFCVYTYVYTPGISPPPIFLECPLSLKEWEEGVYLGTFWRFMSMCKTLNPSASFNLVDSCRTRRYILAFGWFSIQRISRGRLPKERRMGRHKVFLT